MAKKREARFILSAENKTAAALSKVTSDVNRLGGTFQKLGKLVGPALAGLATGAAIKGFASMIQKANAVTDSLAKQSDRLGVATEALQAYRNAAALAGVSQGSLEKGLARLNRNIGDIKNGLITGSSPVAKAFEQLGLTIGDLSAMKPEEVFERMVDELGGIQDTATRSALAMQIFGRSGQEMITLFNEGNPAIQQSRELLRGLGLEISRIDARKAELANDSFERLTQVLDAAKQKLAIELSPAIEMVFTELLKTGAEGQNFGQKIATGAATAIETFRNAANAASVIGNTISAGFNLVQGAVSGLVAIITGFAAEVVQTIGTRIPESFNKLLADAERMTQALQQGFSDMATNIANAMVASMNKVGQSIEKTVNGSLLAINVLIGGLNRITGTSFSGISPVTIGDNSRFNFAQFDRPDFGRVGNFGGDLATGLGDTSRAYGDSANKQVQDAAVDIRQAVQAAQELLTTNDSQLAQTLQEARTYADELTGAIDGSAGGASGGKGGGKGGGTKGAMDRLKEATEKTGESIKETFNILNEYGKSVTEGISRAIDDFVRNGEFSIKSFGQSILQELAAITAKAAILGGILGNQEYGGNGSGLVGATLGAIFAGGSGAASYAGGGFTGYGARSGGIDGRGGFPAILHPNETVVDHSAGQSASGPVTVQQTVIVRETMPAGVASQIVRAASQQALAKVQQTFERGGQKRRAFGLG